MKFKKLAKCSLAVALVFGAASALTGCGKDEDTTQTEKSEQEKVYDLYVSYMNAQGETPLTYQEWLKSIKGAPGNDGEDGEDGEDGSTWLSGDVAPITTQGKNGDFYFDRVAKKIYKKVNGAWSELTQINDGAPGATGNGIASIEETATNGKVHTYTITFTDSTVTPVTFTVTDGADGAQGGKGDTGVSITNAEVNSAGHLLITFSNSSTPVNVGKVTGNDLITNVTTTSNANGTTTYKMHYSDGSYFEFAVTDGKDGATWLTGTTAPLDTQGKNGDFYFDSTAQAIYHKADGTWGTPITTIEDGATGGTGATGVGIASIEKTGTSGNVDTYTITFTDSSVTPVTFTVTNGVDGTTWLTGVVNPDEAKGLNPKEGDFYFDKVANNIWTYTDGEWVLEVDLEDDVLPLTLVDDKEYRGSIMGKEFNVTLETEDDVQKVKELYISGVVDDEGPINCAGMVISFEIKSNVAILTVDTSHFTEKEGSTSTQYLVLDENDDSVLVTYVSDEDKELIKGTYQSNNTRLTVGNSSILYWDGDVRIRGTYQVVGHEDDVYTLNFTTDTGKILTVDVNIYNRYYNFDIEDFSGEYSLGEELSFVYDSKTGTVTFEGEEPVRAYAYSYVENSLKAAIMFEVSEGSYAVYEVDYISGTVVDENGFAGIIPFMGNAILYGEGANLDRFYIINERDNLERVYDNSTVYSNDVVSVSLNLSDFSYSISTNDNSYSYRGSLMDLFGDEEPTNVITVIDGTTAIEFTFNNDMTINDLNIIGEEIAIVTNEKALTKAIETGSESVSLAADIVLSTPINVTNDVVIEGKDHTISASSELGALIESDLSEVYTLFYIAEDVNVEFNDIGLDGNQAGRAITAINGHIVFNDTYVSNGVKKGVYRSGGVFIGYAASFTMRSGSILGNNSSVEGEPTEENYYLYYSADLWIGANSVGSVVSIEEGALVGKVFVNANSYSANNPGSFTLNGGTVETIYLEYDDGYGATFNYESGRIDEMIISTTTSGTAFEDRYTTEGENSQLTPGTVYKGGQNLETNQ